MKNIKKLIVFGLLIIAVSIFPVMLFAQETVNADDIIDMINNGEDIHYENTIINGDLDFMKIENAEINSNFQNVHYINSKVEFINCTFKGKIISYEESCCTFVVNITMFNENATFSGCTFEKVANFDYVYFMKSINFENIEFKSKTTFIGTFFSFSEGETSFAGTLFAKDVTFSGSRFYGTTYFDGVEFSGEVNFQYAIFYNDTSFKGTTHNGKPYDPS